MRVRAILLISIGLNLALGAALAWRPRPVSAPVAAASTNATVAPKPVVKTHVLVRKQFFSWGEIESKDFPTYIANLRDIDCPEPTIRDIIVAEVDQIFAKRRATEVPSLTRQWWKTDPDPALVRTVEDKIEALERERTALLDKLLGPEWARDLPEYQTAELDLSGGFLDELTDATRRAVQTIAQEERQREDTYLRERERLGETPDAQTIARMQQETRQRLSTLLTPTQLEEYLLRYSPTAERLRRDLRGFEPTAEEFRTVFRALDPADMDIQLHYSADDPASLRKREELQAQTDAALKQALGNERFEFYRMTRDPAFNEARELAEQYGASAEAVLPVYQVNQLAQAQATRIRNDRSLSEEERDRALREVQDEQQKSIQLIVAAKGAARKALEAQGLLPPTPGP